MRRILVATDRSETAEHAVRFAADMAVRFEAELLLCQVVIPPAKAPPNAKEELVEYGRRFAGDLARAVISTGEDPAQVIVDTAEAEDADVVVVGNVGMSGRKEFLLGNVPNRVSHNSDRTVIIVNTRQRIEQQQKKKGLLPPVSGTQEADLRLLGRATQIGKVMARYGLGERASADVPLEERAKSLRAALEELGPTFAKLGQILSTRPDLLPPEFIEELSKLQDDVPPMTEEEVVVVMEEELRVPWEDVFASIDPEPLAAGTIGQVHAATLESGDRVVVKVQRHGAEEEIMRDLGLLELFAEKAEHRDGLRRLVDFPSVIRHLSDSLKRELDFRMEAANVDRLGEVLERYPRLDVPCVYHELSSKRLLVLSFVDGVPVRDAPDSPERREAARQLIESYYRQVLVDGFFHADPHPGNLLWAQDTVYFLDCGMVGEVDPRVRELVLLLVMAFWQEDDEFLAEVVLQLADQELPDDFNFEAFQSEIGKLVQGVRGQSLQEIQLGPILQGITRDRGPP